MDANRLKKLPCYPSTVVYGHAAARGLDIKRWSKGLDSGCVSPAYGISAGVKMIRTMFTGLQEKAVSAYPIGAS